VAELAIETALLAFVDAVLAVDKAVAALFEAVAETVLELLAMEIALLNPPAPSDSRELLSAKVAFVEALLETVRELEELVKAVFAVDKAVALSEAA
jgi:hypothetical protein